MKIGDICPTCRQKILRGTPNKRAALLWAIMTSMFIIGAIYGRLSQ